MNTLKTDDEYFTCYTVCEAFISRELTPGCVGADFFAHLGMLAGKASDGRQHFVWLKGDFSRDARNSARDPIPQDQE
tara:strand:+ start:334 stop:564 length:231 start_codon:yes stop_codon:yes gene_type:complete